MLNQPEYSNYNDKDINNFCKIVDDFNKHANGTNFGVAIDFDLRVQHENRPEELIRAAAKIVRHCLENDIVYVISTCNLCTDSDRKKIEKLAKASLSFKFTMLKKKLCKAFEVLQFFYCR